MFQFTCAQFIYEYIFSNSYDLLPSNNTDGIVERGLNIDIEDSTESQLDESPCKKSLESLFEEVMTPTKTVHQNEIARFYEIHYRISVQGPRNFTQIFL
jgi:hypothetical protein